MDEPPGAGLARRTVAARIVADGPREIKARAGAAGARGVLRPRRRTTRLRLPEEADMTQTAQSLEQLLATHVARFTDGRADWDGSADARVKGFRRAQRRFIGSGASGKADAAVIPAEHFTLSVMFIPPGQGNAPHTHEVEEVFFILECKVPVSR